MLSGHASLSSCPWVLLEDLSSVYTDVEVERKHTHKKRKLADGREKTMVRPHGLLLLLLHQHMHIHMVNMTSVCV